MKMNSLLSRILYSSSRRGHDNHKIARRVVIIVVLFFSLVVFFGENFADYRTMRLAKPFFVVHNSIKEMGLFFYDKETLIGDNLNLEEKVEELEVKLLYFDNLKDENREIKKILFYSKENSPGILASVLSRPPKSPYDVIIIDAGSEDGIKKGMMVTTYGYAFLGSIEEVYATMSKVKLASFPKEESNVIISPTDLVATAVGRGGENMEITLSRSSEVNAGDRVMLAGNNPLLLGVVEKTELNLSNSFQKIFFRLPINLQELRYVVVNQNE